MDDWFWTQDRNLSIVGYCTQIVSTTNQIYLVIDYIPPNQYRVIKNRKLWTLLNIFNTSEHIQPLLPTTILNRKQYVPPKSLSKDSCSSLFQFAELFFFCEKQNKLIMDKNHGSHHPPTVWLPTSDQSAPCRVWFWYAWRDDLQFARVHAPSPGWTDSGVSVVSAERCGIFFTKKQMDGSWNIPRLAKKKNHPPISPCSTLGRCCSSGTQSKVCLSEVAEGSKVMVFLGDKTMGRRKPVGYIDLSQVLSNWGGDSIVGFTGVTNRDFRPPTVDMSPHFFWNLGYFPNFPEPFTKIPETS